MKELWAKIRNMHLNIKGKKRSDLLKRNEIINYKSKYENGSRGFKIK